MDVKTKADPIGDESLEPVAVSTGPTSIGDYLIQRLLDYGIKDLFGIPGDYVLAFYSMLENSEINVVGCTREDCAGYAADAYARLNGMGAVCVTYCVGGLSVCNSIAGAYAEKSPVVVISGSPGLNERINDPLLHHKVRDFRTQIEVFEKLCIACAELNDPVTAFYEIDRVLDAAARFKRPVYIEIPRDMVKVVPPVAHSYQAHKPVSDAHALKEAVAETIALIRNAQQPLIIAGVEIHRFALQDSVLKLAEARNIPITATVLSKSVIRETHPLYVGIYEGQIGHAAVTDYVETSDCVLLLGTFMTDLNLGLYSANLDPEKCIYATSEGLRIRHHHYHDIELADFIKSLAAADLRVNQPSAPALPLPRTESSAFEIVTEAPITISRIIDRLNQQIDENTIFIADIGDSLFAATNLVTHGRTEFLCPAYYTSMGFAAPAVLGAQIARPDRRVVALIGDGAFQMTGMELANVVRFGFAPIVIIMDNHGYGTERFLQAEDWSYNDILAWNYTKLTEVFGGGRGYEVRTEGDFEQALTDAWADTTQLSLIHVYQAVDDVSESLKRIAERLAKKI